MPSIRNDQPLYVAKAELFRSLGSPVRIRILELLVVGEKTVANLLSATEIEPSSLSQHLKVLRSSGLVESSRQGNAVTYRVTDPAVGELLVAARAVLASTLGSTLMTLEALDAPEP